MAWEVEINFVEKPPGEESDTKTIMFDDRPGFSEGPLLFSVGSNDLGSYVCRADAIGRVVTRQITNTEKSGL